MHLTIAIGPGNGVDIRETLSVWYVCDPLCLASTIGEHVSPEWAQSCDTVSAWPGKTADGSEVTTYVIDSPRDETTSNHEYCKGCGDLVTRGETDGDPAISPGARYRCGPDGCTFPAYR